MDFRRYGLRDEEYQAARNVLGRDPNECELWILGVMWSEHCSYKSTKKLLKHFPTTGAKVVLGPGENAGIVDIGEGVGAAFKVESHNHPSAVAPYQGAATGVGGDHPGYPRPWSAAGGLHGRPLFRRPGARKDLAPLLGHRPRRGRLR